MVCAFDLIFRNSTKAKTTADFPFSPSKCLIVSYFRLRSLNPFEVNVYMQHEVFVKIISLYEYHFFQHQFLKRISFLHWLPLHLCQQSVDYVCVGLFLDLFSVTLILSVFPFHNPTLSWLLQLQVGIDSKSWIYVVQVHQFCCSFSIVLTTLVPFIFGINVRISYWYIFLKACWDFDWHCIEFIDEIGESLHKWFLKISFSHVL